MFLSSFVSSNNILSKNWTTNVGYLLFCFLFNNRFILLVQSNFYIDFFLKKLCEVFIRNTLIYSAQFFGEKYIIEVLTKKIIDSFLYTSNKFFNI